LNTKVRNWTGIALVTLSALWLFQSRGLYENPCLAEDRTTGGAANETDYKPAPETKLSLQGKRIFASQHCAACHSTGTAGGCLGPPLTGVGARRSKEFITARITNEPAEIKKFRTLYCSQELMLHPRLPRKLSEPLVAYLMTLPQPEGGFKVGKHEVRSNAEPGNKQKPLSGQTTLLKGKKLFYERGCTACHSVYGTGGQFAPALDGVSNRLTRDQIETRITKAELLALGPSFEYQERGTVMPPCGLSAPEIQEITAFLMTLPARK
jgi:mono/diheme cytochrome c family protein